MNRIVPRLLGAAFLPGLPWSGAVHASPPAALSDLAIPEIAVGLGYTATKAFTLTVGSGGSGASAE